MKDKHMYKTIKNELFFDEEQAYRYYNLLRDKDCKPVLEKVDYYDEFNERFTAFNLSWEE